MSSTVVASLAEDHTCFEKLFGEIEADISALVAGRAIDVHKLVDLAWYLTKHVRAFHQCVEELIYDRLLDRVPHFSDDIYPLGQDHRETEERGALFHESAKTLDLGNADSRERLKTAAQAYILHERNHYISEEEVFYPFALKYLLPDHWDRIAKVRRDACERSRAYLEQEPRLQRFVAAAGSV